MSSTSNPLTLNGEHAVCTCGHTARWHSHDGAGCCEHDATCDCDHFTSANPTDIGANLRWEHGSLPTVVLERILVDAMADIFAGCYRRDQPPLSQARLFREALERCAGHATGIPLAGLPDQIRGAAA